MRGTIVNITVNGLFCIEKNGIGECRHGITHIFGNTKHARIVSWAVRVVENITNSVTIMCYNSKFTYIRETSLVQFGVI